jgi:hypothetical protein
MKNKIKWQGLVLILSLVFTFIACGNGEETHTHTLGAWEETKAPTETAEGEETRMCAACGEKETRPIQKLPEQPQFRETTITLTFGENTYTAKVQGTLLQAEWNGVPNKVKGLLEAGYSAINPLFQNTTKTYFENNDVKIIVQNTTEYTKYKVADTEPAVMYFNIAVLENITAEDSATAISYMRAGMTASE